MNSLVRVLTTTALMTALCGCPGTVWHMDEAVRSKAFRECIDNQEYMSRHAVKGCLEYSRLVSSWCEGHGCPVGSTKPIGAAP
jgi:hypothetical protein